MNERIVVPRAADVKEQERPEATLGAVEARATKTESATRVNSKETASGEMSCGQVLDNRVRLVEQCGRTEPVNLQVPVVDPGPVY